jgi:hypothetical protein
LIFELVIQNLKTDQTMKSIKNITKAIAAALFLGGILGSNIGQAATPYVMSSGDYSLDFADIANWANNFASGIGAANWGSVPVQNTGTIGDGIKTTVATDTFKTGSSGGVQKGTGNIVLLSTSTANACAIDLNLDFTGRNAGTVSFDAAEINNSTGDRDSVLQLFYTTDGSTFTELTGTSLPFVARNNVASSAHISISLPSALNGSSTVRLRFYERSTTSGATPTGSQPKISIDNISVTSTGASGSPPVITGISPSTVTTNAGNTVQYTVTSTGDAANYFWYKETASTTNLIVGANTATLTLNNVLATDTASYQVVLTNSSGADTSAVVTLTVIDPAINTQPAIATRLAGGSATFTVAASGTPTLSYQWYSKPTSDNFDFSGATAYSNAGNVSGANTSSLTITNLSDADVTNLFVVVTGGAGSITSSVVTLTVASTTSLAYWNFNGELNVASPAVFAGVGTATAVNCVSFSNNIASGLDFDFSSTPNAWGSSTYPAAGVSNKTAGVQFKTSTSGAKNIRVSFDTRASTTANKYQRLQYTTNGADYLDFFAGVKFASANLYESRSFDLSGFPGVDNNTNFAIRIVSEFESTALNGASTNAQYVGVSSTYAQSGTLSYDIVNITGDAITNANTPPTITSFTNVITTDTNSPVVLNFTVGDAESDASELTVTAISSNQMVMPDYKITPGGTGASRTLTLDPFNNEIGVAPILVKVTDGSNDVSATWFYVTVNPGNQWPTISGLMNTNCLGNTANNYTITVGDDATPVASLTANAFSGNSTLVPNDVGHVSVTGSGATRTVTVVPATDKYGVAPIYVTVNDGFKTSTNVFYLMVRPNTVTLLDDAFDYDTAGPIISQSAGLWTTHSGTPGQMQVGSGVVTLADANGEDVNAPLLSGPYTASSAPVLYSSFTLNYSSLPVATNSYFAHFITGSSTFNARVFASTALAAPGKYRIGIANAGATVPANQIAVDLDPGVNYTIVTRLVLSNSVSTIWINPTSESDPSVTDTASGSSATVTGYAFRESAQATLTIDNLKVGKNFLTVISNIVDVPPVANPDGYSVNGNTSTNVFSPLTNDVLNLPVGTLSIASVSATNGTATISGTNVLFTPTTSFAGIATIGYTIADGFGGNSTSLMTVTVVGPSGPIPLNMNVSGGALTFNWSDPLFSLQSATNVAGPYITIPGAASGFSTNVTTEPARFFRLKF